MSKTEAIGSRIPFEPGTVVYQRFTGNWGIVIKDDPEKEKVRVAFNHRGRVEECKIPWMVLTTKRPRRWYFLWLA